MLVYTLIVIRDTLHEDFARKQESQGSSDRGFAIVFAVFFVLVGFSPLRTHHQMRWWAFPVAGLFLFVGILKPVWLHPLNKYWTKLGLLMGRIVSPVITAVLFYAVVTPTALLFRILGKDPLRLSRDPAARSYWIERHPPGPAPETMTNQF
jgi:Saxitoxin biosynthesis operon protein SxtJ